MKAISEMTCGELSELLQNLKDKLDEIEEERRFVLGQTGLHVPGSTVKNYEDEMNSLKDRMKEAEEALSSKE
jgi:uncharacterized protein YukE